MWTMDNTEGFTQAELDTMNRVIESVFASANDENQLNAINDAINNFWYRGVSERALERAVRKHLGLAA